MKDYCERLIVTRRRLMASAVAPVLLPHAGWAKPAGATDMARVTRTGDTLVLANSAVGRSLRLPTAQRPSLATTDFRSPAEPSRCFTRHDGKFQGSASEFGFYANGKAHDGRDGWRLVSIYEAGDELQGSGSGFDSVLRTPAGDVEVVVRYLLYPSLPLVRKRLTIWNLTSARVPVTRANGRALATTGFSWRLGKLHEGKYFQVDRMASPTARQRQTSATRQGSN